MVKYSGISSGSSNSNDPLSFNKRYYSQITKFDIDGNVIWKKNYDIRSQWNSASLMYELPNGNILVAGYLDTMSNKNIAPTNSIAPIVKIRLLEIDPQGQVVKRRYIGNAIGLNTEEYPRSLRFTKDGGFVLAVWDFDRAPPAPMSIIKIDANYCDTITEYCKEMDEVGLNELSLQSPALSLYPNPANGFTNLNCQKDCKMITIADQFGRTALSIIPDADKAEQMLDTSELAAGVYFVKIQNKQDEQFCGKLVIVR